MVKLFACIAVLIMVTTRAWSEEPFGIWRTKTNETGAYLHVRVLPCKNRAAQLCGVIQKTFKTPHTEIIGRPIFWNLEKTGTGTWAKGWVWDPETNRDYRAKVSLEAQGLRVRGCLGPLCDGQYWTRVK